jgi:LysM repeat protein
MDYRRFYFTFILSLIFGFSIYGIDQDSIGVVSERDELFVLHKVEPQETLYALSRRYRIPVESIVENNQITGNNLSVGSVLRIPWTHRLTHMVEPGETLYAISKNYGISVGTIKRLNKLQSNDLATGTVLEIVKGDSNLDQESDENPVPGFHIVAAEETLYSVSKKYDLNLADLRRWNGLNGNYLQAGDTLVLRQPDTKVTAITNIEDVKPVEATTSLTAKSVQTAPPTLRSTAGGLNAEAVTETGIAAVINGNTDTRKYLALHPTAPIGTIMRVRNEMTNLSVFVRVVGQLPATGSNNNVLIRLSPAAQEALGALDDRFRVELSYVPNQ